MRCGLAACGRFNRLRFANEFDKAAGVFESIVSEFPEEAEAYWGLCLCKYGIEYVDDPATAKKIPTCHRTSYDSIFDDNNFDMAQEYADVVARKVYRDEAKEIDRLQKSILEIAKNEDPFDIFICYKETANDGQRTIDSVLAQDIYDNLTEKGYKVFFARITLEDKLGQEYEPYIFSALSSAKVMLVIGTDYEYFNAVWVKNEWSRFLDMMKSDKKKTLIPCYKDIDAYDIPGEFRHLQAQDMGKVGFMQDIVRGIGKIIPLQSQAVQSTFVLQQTAQNATVNSLLERAFMFLEEENWEKADEYSEKVLDIDPKNGWAYYCKLLIDLRYPFADDLSECTYNYLNNPNYKKAEKFADGKLKELLESGAKKVLLTGFCGQIAKIVAKTEAIEAKYQFALSMMEQADSDIKFRRTALLFGEIADYKNSKELAAQCRENANENLYQKALKAMISSVTDVQFETAAKEFSALGNYHDSVNMAAQCHEKALEYRYQRALSYMNASVSEEDFNNTARYFEKLGYFHDSSTLAQRCHEKAKQIREREERQRLDQEAQQRKQQINNLKRTIPSKRTEISDLHRTISSHRTDLQQQQSIYNANAGKLFGKKKAQL